MPPNSTKFALYSTFHARKQYCPNLSDETFQLLTLPKLAQPAGPTKKVRGFYRVFTFRGESGNVFDASERVYKRVDSAKRPTAAWIAMRAKPIALWRCG